MDDGSESDEDPAPAVSVHSALWNARPTGTGTGPPDRPRGLDAWLPQTLLLCRPFSDSVEISQLAAGTDSSDEDTQTDKLASAGAGWLHDIDVFEVFGVAELARLQDVSRIRLCVREAIIAVSSICVCSFSIHALLLWNSCNQLWLDGMNINRKQVVFAFIQDVSLACLYLLLGVALPLLTRPKNVPLERVLSVANSFNKSLSRSSKYMILSYFVWPVTFLYGVAAPLLTWVPDVFPLEQRNAYDWSLGEKYIDLQIALSFFTWSTGMLLLGPSIVEEIGTQAVKEIVSGTTESLQVSGGKETCWVSVGAKVKALDYLLSEAFGWDRLGRLVVFRVTVLFFLAAWYGLVSIVHRNPIMRYACKLFGLLSAVFASALLFRLGLISYSCSGTEPGSGALKAALIAKISQQRHREEQPKEETTAMRNLMFYLRERQLGVELAGVQITTALVANIALRGCCYLPAVVAVIDGVWQNGVVEQEMAERCHCEL